MSDKVDLTAETFGIETDQPSMAIGMRWTACKHFALGIAATRQLEAPRATVTAVTATHGVSAERATETALATGYSAPLPGKPRARWGPQR